MASTAFTNQSEAAKTGLNLTLDPVERFITAGLQQKIYEVLGVRAGWLTSDDEQAVLQKLFGRENQGANDASTQYPYGLLTMQSMAEAEDMGNIHAFSVRGLTAIIHDADARAYRVQLMPTDFDVRFKFVTNDYLQLLSVVTKLMHSRRRGWLKFNIVYGRITLAISVVPDANLTVPTKESTAGALSEYPLELSLKVKGYTSLATLIEQQVVTKISMSTSVQDNPTIGSDAAQVWAWTTAPMSAIASMTVNDNVPGVYVPSPAPTVLSVSNATAAEGSTLVHTVTLTFASSTPVTFSYALAGVTATALLDYTTTSTFSQGVTLVGNTLTVPPFVTQFTISYPALTDALTETTETTTLTVGGVSGTGSITNVDAVPVYPNYGFFNMRGTGLILGDLFSEIPVRINNVDGPHTLPLVIEPAANSQVVDAAFIVAFLNSTEPSTSFDVILGGGVGTVAPLGPMPIGTVRTAAPNPPLPDRVIQAEADVPMRVGDKIFITAIDQPIVGDPYSVTFVVGPDALNGEQYVLAGPSFVNTNLDYTLTRLANVGIRSAA